MPYTMLCILMGWWLLCLWQWLIAENTLWMFRGLVLVVGVILTAVTVSTSTSNVNGDSLYSVRHGYVCCFVSSSHAQHAT